MKNSKLLNNKIILIGPLPPPWGGATVSFKLFYDYIKNFSDLDIHFIDAPIRNARDMNPPGEVNHFKTVKVLLSCLPKLPYVSMIIVFGSRNFGFFYGILLLIVSKLFKKPFYIRFFGGHPAQSKLFKFSAVKSIILKVMSLADQIVLQAHVGAKEFPLYLRDKISVVFGYRPSQKPNFLDKKLSDGIKRFVYAGDISEAKGVPHLLAAFKSLNDNLQGHPKIELHLYGAGSAEIVDQTKREKNVFYHGRVDNLILRKSLSQYDIFVFPSTYISEGHPGAVIEALMAGLPVIASDLPGIKEVVQERTNGLLVKAGDIEGLAYAMNEMVDNKELFMLLLNGALESSKKFQTDIVLPKLAVALGIKV
jgi:glycosyltransferase involved in cell wall biosynthesis